MNNKKILSTALAASTVLSSSYLFFMTNNLNNETNKVYAAASSTGFDIADYLIGKLAEKLGNKGITLNQDSKDVIKELYTKLTGAGLKIFDNCDLDTSTSPISLKSVEIFGVNFAKDYKSELSKRYRGWYQGDKSNDSKELNTLISSIGSYLIKDDGSINYENLEKLNELTNVVTKNSSNYEIEYNPFTKYVRNIDCLEDFINKTNFKYYSLLENAGTVKLVYNVSSLSKELGIDNSDLQKFLEVLYNSKERINKVIKDHKRSNAGLDIDVTYGKGSESDQKPENSPSSTDNSNDSSSSGGSFVSSSFSTSSSGSSSTSSSGSTSAGTDSTTGYVQHEKTSVAGDALKNGNQVTLNEKITVSNIDALKISDKAKATTKKVLDKIESMLKVANGSTNSSVVDVSKVGSDPKLNNVTINLDKSYIGKDLYISYIFDDNNIYQLTEGNKWEKLTDDTKEIKGVKMDKTSSLKINGISSACTIVITTKN